MINELPLGNINQKEILSVLKDLLNESISFKQQNNIDVKYSEAINLMLDQTVFENRGCTTGSKGSILVDLPFKVKTNVCSTVINNLVALLKKFYLVMGYRPFLIRPTAIPNLDPLSEKIIEENVARRINELAPALNLEQEVELPPELSEYQDILSSFRQDPSESSFAVLEQRLKELETNILLKNRRIEAQKKVEELSSKIEDILEESKFVEMINSFIYDVCVSPYAVIKYPVTKIVNTQIYLEDSYQDSFTEINTFESKSILNIFPSPYSSSLHTADYIIERVEMSRIEFLEYIESIEDGGLKTKLKDYRKNNASCQIFIYTGKVIPFDEIRNKDIDTLSKCRIIYTSDFIISIDILTGADLNLPYYGVSFYRPPLLNFLFGESPASKLSEVQKEILLKSEYQMKHYVFASSYITELNEQLLSRNGSISEKKEDISLSPFSVFIKNSLDDSKGDLIKVHSFPSRLGELSQDLLYSEDKVYKILGISPTVFGDMKGISAVARTSGNVAVILDRADAPINQVISTIDENFILPLIKNMVSYIREEYPNDYVGDDALVIEGVDGLTNDQSKVSNVEKYLSLLSMYPQIVSPEAFTKLLIDIGNMRGIDVDTLFAKEIEAGELEATGLTQDNAISNSNPITAPAQNLDGRSAIAQDTLIGN
ncbi:MAG: putative portal protein [Caudoviricetes sp.]|nr:MAG: putative portal protein [Caudoviricetes sp.]